MNIDFEEADVIAHNALEHARSLAPGAARTEAFKEAGSSALLPIGLPRFPHPRPDADPNTSASRYKAGVPSHDDGFY